MKRDNGLAAITLVLMIIIILGIVGLTIYFSIGDEGVLTKVTQDEEEFNKTEVLDELNITITEKYLETYKNEVVNGRKIEEVYNKDVAINYLKEKGIIEPYDENKNKYYINVSALRSDIKQGKGEKGSSKDVYVIEKSEKTEDYEVVYLKNENERISIGNLEFEQKL